MPEISVIVPVYNAEHYLRDCVDSLLGQTFSDLEVILVDDGSPDRCGEICDEYAKTDPRVRVLHQRNQGQAAARNHALDISSGEWLCFVDSDDLIHPQMVELLLAAARDSGAPMAMCPMLEARILPEDFLRPRGGGYTLHQMDEKTLTALFDRGEYPGWVACAKLVRRGIVEGYRFTPGRVYEDNEAVCRWIYAAGTLAQVPEAMYFYRTNQGSTTQQGFTLKQLDYLWALESILRFYTGVGFRNLALRFSGAYAETAASCCCMARTEWNRRDVARQVRSSARKLFLRDRLPLTKGQFETMLDAMHPRLIRLYWPLEGAVRTVRETGLPGLIRKLLRHIDKGDGE